MPWSLIRQLFGAGGGGGGGGGIGPPEPGEGGGGGGNLPPDTSEGGAPQPTSSQPQAANLWRLKQAASISAYDYSIKDSGEVIVLGEDGQVSQIRSSGETSNLSAVPIKDLLKSSFSYDGKKLAISFGDKLSPQTSVFDTTDKTWKPLDIQASIFDWAPKSYELAYQDRKSEGFTLNTWNLGDPKAKAKELIRLEAPDLVLFWTDSKRIVLTDRGSARIKGAWWNFDPQSKNLSPVLVDQPGLEVLAQKSGDQALVFKSSKEERGGGLFLVDQEGKTSRLLSFLTMPEKCAFERGGLKATTTSLASVGGFMVCAIPEEPLSSLQLPDDYQKRKIFTTDSFYRISLTDGGIQLIFSGSNLNLDAENLKTANQKIYFINRADQKLYSITAP